MHSPEVSEVLRLVDGERIEVDPLVAGQLLVEDVHESLDPWLDGREDSHPAQFRDHVTDTGRTDREKSTAYVRARLEDNDGTIRILLLEPPGGIDARDPTANDDGIDRLIPDR
jgi:hypothetical protein